MNDKVLVDTNVLVYAYDRSEPRKQAQAAQLLDRLATSGSGIISTQVLSEFFVVVTRKIAAPLSAEQAYVRIQNYLQSWTVVDPGMIVLEAARGVVEHRLSFWDAQIWAAARLNQIPVILSEDFNVGGAIEGVRFVDPFSVAFRLENW